MVPQFETLSQRVSVSFYAVSNLNFWLAHYNSCKKTNTQLTYSFFWFFFFNGINKSISTVFIVSFAAVFRVVTQERCVTTLKTAAKETTVFKAKPKTLFFILNQTGIGFSLQSDKPNRICQWINQFNFWRLSLLLAKLLCLQSVLTIVDSTLPPLQPSLRGGDHDKA